MCKNTISLKNISPAPTLWPGRMHSTLDSDSPSPIQAHVHPGGQEHCCPFETQPPLCSLFLYALQPHRYGSGAFQKAFPKTQDNERKRNAKSSMLLNNPTYRDSVIPSVLSQMHLVPHCMGTPPPPP